MWMCEVGELVIVGLGWVSRRMATATPCPAWAPEGAWWCGERSSLPTQLRLRGNLTKGLASCGLGRSNETRHSILVDFACFREASSTALPSSKQSRRAGGDTFGQLVENILKSPAKRQRNYIDTKHIIIIPTK